MNKRVVIGGRISCVLLISAVCFLLCANRAQAATYYISSSIGSDSNTAAQAQSKSTPWAHLPGMPSCTSICASYSPKPGDNFILKGGDTWTASDLGVNWNWSGNSGAKIYIGVDQTWFAGASWTRPIFNCGNNPCAGPQGRQMWIDGAYVTVDNIELTGLRQTGGSIQNIAIYSDHDEIENCYIHGWSRAAGETDNGSSFAIAANSSMGEGKVAGSSFHDNVIDGSDTTRDMWGGIEFGDQVYNNVIRYVVSGMLGDFTDVHGNLMEYTVYSYAGDHANLMFIFGPFNGSTNVWAYNNVVRHNRLAPGSMCFWINGNSGGHPEWVSYAYNNVIYDCDNGVMALGSHPASGNTGTYFIYNNTIDANGDAAMGNGEAPPRSVTHFANNHCVNASSFITETGTTGINDGGNLLQTLGQANAAGYTTNQTYAYSPTGAGSPTVGAGSNLTALCSGNLGAMSSDTIYPTYDAVNHRVVMRTVVARPASGAWDIGAYEYQSSGNQPPVINSPTTAAGTVGSAFSYQITATGSPTNYNATGLPSGLGVNTTNGLISGTPTAVGTSSVTISAMNAYGTNSVPLTLTIISTPPGPTGLVGWWKLDESSSTTAADSSGNGNNGTLSGGTWQTSGGHIAGALHLNAFDVVNCGAGASLNTPSVTVAFWMKPDSLGNVIPVDKLPATGSVGYAVKLRDTGTIWFRVGAEGGPALDVYGGSNIYTNGVWTHVACSFDAATGNMRMYINGVVEAHQPTYAVTLNASNTTFRMGSTVEQYAGLLDDVRVYDHALTSNDVVTVMTGGGSSSEVIRFVPAGMSAGSTGCSFSWSGSSGATNSFKVYRSTNLVAGSWQLVAPSIARSGTGTNLWTDTNVFQQAFYRVATPNQ
jgi:hypothetical protein